MADRARAKEIIAAFPADDPIKAAQHAAHWLALIKQSGEFKLAWRYQLIDMLDAALKPHGQNLLEQYLALKPQLKIQEGRLWQAATDLWKALGDAYLGCVAQAEADPAAAAALGTALPPLLARAMRSQMLQVKWILMRYGYVSDSFWQSIARLHQYAETGGFLDELVDIYGGAHGRGTVRREFLRALMLGVSSTGGLSPIKQNIAERAIAHFSSMFVCGTSAAEGHTFLFDLNGGRSPARVLASPAPGARLVYFGAGSALQGLQKIVDELNDNGALRSDINLGPSDNVDQMADTLLHLAFNWEPELPARDSERRRVSDALRVTHGFDGIMAQGSGRGVSDIWVVENASADGYGAIVPEQRSEWLHVGVLIGIRPDSDGAAWGAGVVRRVETDARGRRLVGIQMLSRAVATATMSTLIAGGGRGAAKYVILLDADPSNSGYLLAVLRPNTFTLTEALETTRTTDGKTFVVTPSGLVESGPDFDRVRFKTV
jgi:hypothetical protein